MSSKDVKTPPACSADFCLIPLGTPTASVSAQIADVQRLMKQSGLKYSMHSAGTTVGELHISCICYFRYNIKERSHCHSDIFQTAFCCLSASITK